ncbi:MAG TPA: glycosyltransferase [Candidatus Acidoferrales bacterium]|nr:glycosyltransferase [Candidatus Acidoferrales bacterium]
MTAPPAAKGAGPGDTVAFLSLHASPLARLGQRENGGLNVYVRSVCEELGARGVHTDVFVRRTDPDEPAEQAMGPRSRVVAVHAGPARRLSKHQLPNTRDEYLEAVRYFMQRSGRRYLAIHSHYWLTVDVGAELAEYLGVPWLHTAHTLAAVKGEFGFDGDGPQRLLAERRAVSAGARLVANTPGEAQGLTRLYGAHPQQVVVAPPGVDLVRFQPRDPDRLRSRLKLVGRKVVLFAGRLEPLKGPDTLLDAFAILVKRDGVREPVQLLFVGDDSSDGAQVDQRGMLEARVRELGLSDRVCFLGARPQDRLALLYCLADVVVVPSYTESFGLVALEAQACGTPVVAASVGGLRDVVAHGSTGYLVEGHNPADYAEAITRVIAAPPGAEALMRQAAWRRAQSFTWERTVDLLLPEYGLPAGLAAVAGREG